MRPATCSVGSDCIGLEHLPNSETSDAGLRLIKAYEGFRPDSRQLPDGRWVIGFGHKAAREGLTITEAEAEAILPNLTCHPLRKR